MNIANDLKTFREIDKDATQLMLKYNKVSHYLSNDVLEMLTLGIVDDMLKSEDPINDCYKPFEHAINDMKKQMESILLDLQLITWCKYCTQYHLSEMLPPLRHLFLENYAIKLYEINKDLENVLRPINKKLVNIMDTFDRNQKIDGVKSNEILELIKQYEDTLN